MTPVSVGDADSVTASGPDVCRAGRYRGRHGGRYEPFRDSPDGPTPMGTIRGCLFGMIFEAIALAVIVAVLVISCRPR